MTIPLVAGPGVPDLQRQANRAVVLRLLGDGTPRPVSGLKIETGLSRPTLETIVTDLVDEGWLEVAETTGTGGSGRPARHYTVAGGAALVAGVDVGVGKVLVIISDVTGAERARARVSLPADADSTDRVRALRDAVDEAVGLAGRTRAELTGLAVGVPGVVDPGGTILRSVVVPQWTGPAFAAELSEWTGCPATVANDTNLALLAEHRRGAARGYADVVYVLVGRRTRAGIMIDGEVHAGRYGSAGEVGSVPGLYFDTPALLLGPAAARRTSDVAPVFARAQRGDHRARARVDRFCARLADTVSALALVLDPEIVVLGGGVSRAGAVVLDGVRAHLAVDALPRGGAPLTLSDLGDEAVAVGAAQHALLVAAKQDPALAAIISAPSTPSVRSAPSLHHQRSEEIIA